MKCPKCSKKLGYITTRSIGSITINPNSIWFNPNSIWCRDIGEDVSYYCPYCNKELDHDDLVELGIL